MPRPSYGLTMATGVSGKSPPKVPSMWKKSGEERPLRALFQPGSKCHMPGADGNAVEVSKPGLVNCALALNPWAHHITNNRAYPATWLRFTPPNS